MNEMLCTTPKTEKPQVKIQAPMYSPQVDILELADELVLSLDLPGVKADDVDVQFERGELTVRAKREAKTRPGKLLFEEFAAGDYYRAFLISQDIAVGDITADLKQGVLTVHLPKAKPAQPQRISVKS